MNKNNKQIKEVLMNSKAIGLAFIGLGIGTISTILSILLNPTHVGNYIFLSVIFICIGMYMFMRYNK